MGITGLIPFLKKASESTHIRNIEHTTVAIDSYCWWVYCELFYLQNMTEILFSPVGCVQVAQRSICRCRQTCPWSRNRRVSSQSMKIKTVSKLVNSNCLFRWNDADIFNTVWNMSICCWITILSQYWYSMDDTCQPKPKQRLNGESEYQSVCASVKNIDSINFIHLQAAQEC